MILDIAHFNVLDTLIEKVEACGGKNVTIAGGAVRDSVLEKPIKDIDIFYEGSLVPETVKELFGEKIEEKSSKDIPPFPSSSDFVVGDFIDWNALDKAQNEWFEKYEGYSDTIDVSTYKGDAFNLNGMEVQLIGVEDAVAHVAAFPCYISRMMYTDGMLVIPKEAIQDISLQVLRFTEECNKKYKAKIEAKYEDYL
jgi:hypothetical protein